VSEILNGLPIDTGGLLADNQALPTTGVTLLSVHDYLRDSTGWIAEKEITLAGNAGPESVNIYQLTGSVEIASIYGTISEVTTLANLTGGHLELWDGTAAVDITKNDGVLSGMAIGTILAKNAAASVTIGINDNSAGALLEGSLAKAYAPFFITQKTGVATYIRWTYTTTDAPIAAKIVWGCRYRPRAYDGVLGTLTAV
jgi:hypothetical protein